MTSLLGGARRNATPCRAGNKRLFAAFSLEKEARPRSGEAQSACFEHKAAKKLYVLRRFVETGAPPGNAVGAFGALQIVGLWLLAAPAVAGQSLASSYTLYCSGCHRADGSGVPDKGIPNLADAGLYAGTPDGRAYLAQVPGISQSRLDDAAASAMLNYVLKKFSSDNLPAGFRPYTAAEVGVLRANKASDAARRRQALLARTAGRNLQ